MARKTRIKKTQINAQIDSIIKDTDIKFSMLSLISNALKERDASYLAKRLVSTCSKEKMPILMKNLQQNNKEFDHVLICSIYNYKPCHELETYYQHSIQQLNQIYQSKYQYICTLLDQNYNAQFSEDVMLLIFSYLEGNEIPFSVCKLWSKCFFKSLFVTRHIQWKCPWNLKYHFIPRIFHQFLIYFAHLHSKTNDSKYVVEQMIRTVVSMFLIKDVEMINGVKNLFKLVDSQSITISISYVYHDTHHDSSFFPFIPPPVLRLHYMNSHIRLFSLETKNVLIDTLHIKNQSVVHTLWPELKHIYYWEMPIYFLIPSYVQSIHFMDFGLELMFQTCRHIFLLSKENKKKEEMEKYILLNIDAIIKKIQSKTPNLKSIHFQLKFSHESEFFYQIAKLIQRENLKVELKVPIYDKPFLQDKGEYITTEFMIKILHPNDWQQYIPKLQGWKTIPIQ